MVTFSNHRFASYRTRSKRVCSTNRISGCSTLSGTACQLPVATSTPPCSTKSMNAKKHGEKKKRMWNILCSCHILKLESIWKHVVMFWSILLLRSYVHERKGDYYDNMKGSNTFRLVLTDCQTSLGITKLCVAYAAAAVCRLCDACIFAN